MTAPERLSSWWQRRATMGGFAITICALCGVVFTADLLTEHTGMEIWIFYLVPLTISLFGQWPKLPVLVAALSSGLVLASFIAEPASSISFADEANRVFLVLTLWLVGGIGWQLIRSRLLLADQNWFRAGQSGLAHRMQGEHSIERLGQRILGFLAEYVSARVGALYVAADGDGSLTRVAAYAFTPDPSTERIARGEGLLGQAAASEACLRISTPPDYLMVRSATGRAMPAEVCLLPARADGVVQGVVELGFFEPVTDIVAELLEAISSSVGIAIRSAVFRRRLEELLEETRRQAELLQAQQEELRAANEELEEQRDRLQESEQELQGQQAQLQSTNRELEEQTEILEQQKAELIHAQAALSDKASELARTSRYKSEFLANMSHELRTPLNSSLILAKLLAENRDGNLDAREVGFAETIFEAGNDLLALIDDILDLSKIDAGQLRIEPERVTVACLVETLHDTFRPVADQKGLKWTTGLDADAPAVIRTDPQRLLQVLKNLLSNAFKFTDEGSVSLRVSVEGDLVSFAVTDTGIGIEPSQHDAIFDAFRQADGTTNRRYGGTGLGLSISKELMHLLGGEIELESAPGRGSTFHARVPVELVSVAEPSSTHRSERRDARRSSARGQRTNALDTRDRRLPRAETTWDDRERLEDRGRTILIVEDDEPFARILYDLAHEHDFQCLVAATADEGLLLARDYEPAAIVLDVGLPDGSGLSVLEQVKRDSATRHIPVHVISIADHSETALAMGAVAYIVKPATREQLTEAFERLDAKLRQKVKRLLVVEDDAAQRHAIVHLLEAENVDIVAVATAEEALDRLRRDAFDCMVTDLHLPDARDGEILERIAADDSCDFPPVIVYTGQVLTDAEEQQLQHVSRSIIIKGARSQERLLDEVTLFLHQVEAALPAERQRMLRQIRHREDLFEGKRILVVEDDVRNLFALSSTLEPTGACVEVARNGREALDVLDRRPDVDLVLMDIMMPEMDGLEATQAIRKMERWTQLPIIALTAKAMPDDMHRCLSAGMNDYIAKPVQVDKLLSLMRVWMPR